jgi:ribose/xylose/arabinose/galactoside ABC-type transport system permease subunit
VATNGAWQGSEIIFSYFQAGRDAGHGAWRHMSDLAPIFRRCGVLIALVLLILLNFAITTHFATMQILSVNLTQVCSIVIVGVGMTLVIATGAIDLSVGALMAIAGAMSPMFCTGQLIAISNIYVAIARAIVIPIIIASRFGLFNGWLITRFSIQPIVATLVRFIAGRGIAQVSTNGDLQVFKVTEF